MQSGVLINAGSISGGSGGVGQQSSGQAGDAVVFGSDAAGTLMLDPGASFTGIVSANSLDLLTLAGTGGTLTGLGSAFVGFSDFLIQSGASWVISGNDSAAGTVAIDGALRIAGALTFDGAIAQSGSLTIAGSLLATGSIFGGGITVASGAVLGGDAVIADSLTSNGTVMAEGGTLTVEGAVLGGGVLEAAAGSDLDIASSGTITQAILGAGTLELSNGVTTLNGAVSVSTIQIDSLATLQAPGTLTSNIVDAGLVRIVNGTLALAGSLSGSGTVSAGTGGTVQLDGGGAFAGTIGGVGTLALGAAFTFDAGAVVSTSAIVDSANLVFGAGETLTTKSGAALTFISSNGGTVSVAGGSLSVLSNVGTLTTSGGGSVSVGVGFVNNSNSTVAVGSGTLAFLGAFTNRGTLTVANAQVSISAAPIGTGGTLEIGTGGVLSLLAGSNADQTVSFVSSRGQLDLATPLVFHGEIADFGGGAVIDLLSTSATSLSYVNDTLSVLNGGAKVAALVFNGGYSQSEFLLGSDGHGGSTISFV